jgi:predicted adenylyl cyclase CyaB
VARNVEIKARVESLAVLAPRVAAIADGVGVDIQQDDTFFAASRGRLKLRAFADGGGELIFYERADTRGPRPSSYVVVPTAEPDAMREALGRAYGEAGRVRKTRTLYHVGRTRVHLDRVEGLGEFVELEVVLAPHEAIEPGVAEAERLMDALGIGRADLVDTAYVDLVGVRARIDTTKPEA